MDKELMKEAKTIKQSIRNEMSSKNPVPFIVYEEEKLTAQLREKSYKTVVIGLVIALCLAIIGLVASNMAWLYVFQSYDYTSIITTYTTETEGGGNAVINKDGEVNINGKSYTDDRDSNED
jgi:hypothetical protein